VNEKTRATEAGGIRIANQFLAKKVNIQKDAESLSDADDL